MYIIEGYSNFGLDVQKCWGETVKEFNFKVNVVCEDEVHVFDQNCIIEPALRDLS